MHLATQITSDTLTSQLQEKAHINQESWGNPSIIFHALPSFHHLSNNHINHLTETIVLILVYNP